MANRRRCSPDAPGGSMPDLLEDLAAEGHLQPEQKRAASVLIAALQASHGASGGLVCRVQERVDASRRPAGRPPGGPSMEPLDRLLKGLRRHERQLLGELVTAREKPRGQLADLGRARSGYGCQSTARAFSVGRVTALLNTIAEAMEDGGLVVVRGG